MEGFFTVVPVDGHAIDVGDIDVSCLRYDGLTWEEAINLCALSFNQGFEVIIWKKVEGGECECGTT